MPEPLPSREAILDLLASQGKPLRSLEIAQRLDVEDSAKPGFFRLLDNLAMEGAVLAHNRDRFGPVKPRFTVADDEREGTLTVNQRGFGFVRSPDFDDDLFIGEDQMGGALHGDTVIARVSRRNAMGTSGEIVKIVKRSQTRIPGTLRRKGASAWVEPDDPRVRGPIVLRAEPVSKAAAANPDANEVAPPRGEDGEAVVVEITRFPTLPGENPEGRLLIVLGTPGDPRVEVLKILARQAVEEPHPAAAVAEADTFGNEVRDEDLVGRVDLTGIPLPTIDPSDARDHDDAIWVERAEDGSFTAYIAIADVSHYVQPGTALDAAALSRGCSVYLPDRAIPMLPRALSSNLCSLLPNVTRLCLCAIVNLDAGAHVTGAKLVEGFMKSRAKLTYDGVARALGFTTKPKRQPEADEFLEGLKTADLLARMLRTKRMRRGALDLNVPEPKVILDSKTGAPTAIERRAEDPGIKKAYEIVEELMLLANEVVAHYLVARGRPTVFRVHPSPDETKLEAYAALCERMGAPFSADEGRDPKKLSQFVKKIASHPRGDVLHMMLLRALKQAFYDTSNIGHFGLASPEYVHFTSPIRRYPDLLVHRGVREVLRSGATNDTSLPWSKTPPPWPMASAIAGTPAPSSVAPRASTPPSSGPISSRPISSRAAASSMADAPPRRGLRTPKPAPVAARSSTPAPSSVRDRGDGKVERTPLKDAAVVASTKERRAMEVEREVVDLYRALYMKDHVGETFEGTVTSMTGMGAFVQLDAPFVDVLVRADAMGKDVYTLNEELMMYVGTRSGDKVMLGDRLMVTIEEVSLQRRLVTGWRIPNNVVDNEPLRQSPFQMREQIAKKRSKARPGDVKKTEVRRVLKTSSRSGKPAKTKKTKPSKSKRK
jgi:ribonuclease R